MVLIDLNLDNFGHPEFSTKLLVYAVSSATLDCFTWMHGYDFKEEREKKLHLHINGILCVVSQNAENTIDMRYFFIVGVEEKGIRI